MSHRHPDVLVAEDLLQILCGSSVYQKMTGKSVSQIVKAEIAYGTEHICDDAYGHIADQKNAKPIQGMTRSLSSVFLEARQHAQTVIHFLF